MFDAPLPPRRTPPPASADLPAAPRRLGGFLPLWLAAFLLPLLAFAGGAWWSWQQVHAEASDRLRRTAELLEESALRAFETHEAVLTAIGRALRGLDWAEIGASAEVHALLRGLERSATALDGLGLVRPDGMMVAVSSRFPFTAIDVSRREYFLQNRGPERERDPRLVGRTGSVVGEVVISVPRMVPVFSLSRPRPAPEEDGFDGLIVTAFAPDYFTALFRRVAESPNDVVTLFRLDGTTLARYPPVTDLAVRMDHGGAVLRAAASAEGQGLVVAPSVFDGIERLYAVRRLSDYPVAVAYGLDPAVLREAWLRRLASIGAIAGSACLLLLAITAHATASARRAQAASDRARAEAERRAEAEAALRHRHRLEVLGQVAAGVAHDFRNTVQAVQGGARLIQNAIEAGDPARARRVAAMVAEAAGRGAALTDRMLAVARRPTQGDAGPGAPPVTEDPAQALTQVAELLRRTFRQGIDIRSEAEGPLPAAVRGARAELEAALLNLAINARDALPEGRAGARIRLRAAAEDVAEGTPHPAGLAAGRYLRIVVADNGTGMDAATLARATEAFFTTKPAGQGTGLGLASVRAFVEEAGGGLWIESAPGQGTTVTLWLPEAG